jgi:hypothetical protein
LALRTAALRHFWNSGVPVHLGLSNEQPRSDIPDTGETMELWGMG